MLRGITIAVGETYARTLEICLVRNMRHLCECVVVTSPDDGHVKAVAAKVPGVRIFETNAFTRYGAKFNKGLAMEEGLDFLGRHEWILIWDADILMPDAIPMGDLRIGRLHGCHRRMMEAFDRWSPDVDWRRFPVGRDGGPVGYFQLFHADDPAIRGTTPWYDVTFTHAGGGDAFFMTHWPAPLLTMLPLEVLHLGPTDTHWFGTDSQSKDMMTAYAVRNQWRRECRQRDMSAVHRVGEIQERVQVPGYVPTGFELPFVRRTKEQAQRRG